MRQLKKAPKRQWQSQKTEASPVYVKIEVPPDYQMLLKKLHGVCRSAETNLHDDIALPYEFLIEEDLKNEKLLVRQHIKRMILGSIRCQWHFQDELVSALYELACNTKWDPSNEDDEDEDEDEDDEEEKPKRKKTSSTKTRSTSSKPKKAAKRARGKNEAYGEVRPVTA